jgi:NADH-quinone oxidoreductase subunit J
MVAAIALTLRSRSKRKFLDPSQQLAVKKKDRVRMVSMPSEKKE